MVSRDPTILTANLQKFPLLKLQILTSVTEGILDVPRTCNQLNVSHPNPREINQINSVLKVSIIDLLVAEILLVTLKPKKLNDLKSVYTHHLKKKPNRKHNSDSSPPNFRLRK